jgi:hypothetical protein
MNGSPLLLDRAELDDRSEFREAVLSGLAGRPRAIPAKFLYDARGSALFDAICELPEYYLTRTEIEILRRFEADIAAMAGPGCALVEYGSGSSVKSRLLIEAMRDLVAYVPIDISRQHLDATANGLRRDYPHLKVEPVCADYMTLARLAASVSAARASRLPGPGPTRCGCSPSSIWSRAPEPKESGPQKQAARLRVSSETGYRSGGESGIAERGPGDTGTRPMPFQRQPGRKSCSTARKNLIQRLSL